MTQAQANAVIPTIEMVTDMILTFDQRASAIEAFVNANGGWGSADVSAQIKTAYDHVLAIRNAMTEDLGGVTRKAIFNQIMPAPKV